MTSQPQPRYKPGDKIGGRYLVHKALMGGMGEVYLCLDLVQNVPLALKTFQQRHQIGPKLRVAFEQEVAIWVALEKHPNIVRCFYLDILDNQPFIHFEWIEGEEGRGADLRSWLRWGPLDLRTTLDFLIDICRGLIHAQQKQPGIVHRDLKPENILVARGRLAKITDFGLVKIVQEASLELSNMESILEDGRQSLSGRGDVVGTPPYMAPEQWEGQAGDVRIDIYAIGCILYELLSGSWPYRASTLEDLRHQHMEAEIPKLPEEDDLLSALNPLITHCLAKQPEERVTTINDLLEELTRLYQQYFAEVPRSISNTSEFGVRDYVNRGITYHNLRRHDEALRDFAQAIELDPQNALAYSNRGNIYRELQRYEEALSDLNHAIALNPQLNAAYSNRGLIYASLQRYEEALSDYTRSIEFDSRFGLVYFNRGVTYHSLRRHDEALRDFTQAIELNPYYALSYSDRGRTYLALHRYDDALCDYTRAIKLDPQLAEAYLGRGCIYSILQRYEEALEDYTQVIELEPYSVQAYFGRGLAYLALQRHDEALCDFTQAIELDPQYAEAYSSRGNIYHYLQRYEEALSDFTRVIELNPQDAEAYFKRGQFYHELQDYDVALRDYDRAIELDPLYAPVYTNIGALFVDRGKLRDALPYFERAAELGEPIGAENAMRARQELDINSVPQNDPAQQSFQAFQNTTSLADMRVAVNRFPFMTNAGFVYTIGQVILQNIPPEHQLAFVQRLAWLRQIANEQQGKENA